MRKQISSLEVGTYILQYTQIRVHGASRDRTSHENNDRGVRTERGSHSPQCSSWNRLAWILQISRHRCTWKKHDIRRCRVRSVFLIRQKLAMKKKEKLGYLLTCKNANTCREQNSENGLEALFGSIRPSRNREPWPHVILQCLPRPTGVFNVAFRDRKRWHGGERYKNGKGRQQNNDRQH